MVTPGNCIQDNSDWDSFMTDFSVSLTMIHSLHKTHKTSDWKAVGLLLSVYRMSIYTEIRLLHGLCIRGSRLPLNFGDDHQQC